MTHPTRKTWLRVTTLLTSSFCLAEAQYYCWPCADKYGVVGKYTLASSEPTRCYTWLFRYLNNVVPGSHNKGLGFLEGAHTKLGNKTVVEPWDARPNLLGMEIDECGTTYGDFVVGFDGPMTKKQRRLVDEGKRLPTGAMHQCPCAVMGRSHIINASYAPGRGNYDARMRDWSPTYVKQLKALAAEQERNLGLIFSPEECEALSSSAPFGLHFVKCAFHSSGPCDLTDIERSVSRLWRANFSRGYVPLMDNNIMLWTSTLSPLLDAFLRDGIEFYPMRWLDSSGRWVFSVLTSPCGKALYEIAATCAGDRPLEQFHVMTTARAIFTNWNEPRAPAEQPIVPLRISRAIGVDRFDKVLQFYQERRLGFQTRVLADVRSEDGSRAVTLMLTPSATVHLQLWSRPEEEPAQKPGHLPLHLFQAAVSVTQIDGTLPAAADFCTNIEWTVARYSAYVLSTHRASLAPQPSNTSTLMPPAGQVMNNFLDDHISWDCTSQECDIPRGGAALYDHGSRVTWAKARFGLGDNWSPYSHDPAGYGLQLHWTYTSAVDFQPSGAPPPFCWSAQTDETCGRPSPIPRDPEEALFT